MSCITFSEIHARVAEHQQREAARQTPIAIARRSAFTLRSVLGDLSVQQRREILDLLAIETAELVPIPA